MKRKDTARTDVPYYATGQETATDNTVAICSDKLPCGICAITNKRCPLEHVQTTDEAYKPSVEQTAARNNAKTVRKTSTNC